MDITIQFVQAAVNKNAEKIITEKLEKLKKKFDWIIRADVFFKEEKSPVGKGYICEIRLSLPGLQLFADANESSFENAAAEAVHDIDVLLKKKKDMLKEKR
jgi:putative sigma-54 modulation protein